MTYQPAKKSTPDDVNVFDLFRDISSMVSGLVRWWGRWVDLWIDLSVVLVVLAQLTLLPVRSVRLVPWWPSAPFRWVSLFTLLATLVAWRRWGPLDGWYAGWRLRRDKGRERGLFARVVRELELKGKDGLFGAGDPYPRLKHVDILNGVVTGTVVLPPGMKDGMTGFLKARESIRGAYPDHPKYGPIERVLLSEAATNSSRHANFVLIRTPLRLPQPLTEVPAARQDSYRLGAGFRGDVRWDLRDDPHAGFFGPTRSGKGNLARYVALQALHAGQQVDVVDGTGSREWEPLLGYGARFTWRPYQGPGDDAGFYQWATGVVNSFGSDVAARNARIGGAGVDNFNHLVAQGKAAGLKRRLLIVDEASTSLTYAGPDKRVDASVKELAGLIDAAAKAAAKAGGHVLVMDQLPYQGQTGVASSTRAQLGRWVATGPVPDQMRQAVSGLQSWPFDTPPGQGFAATGRRGLSAELLVVPEVGRDAVRSRTSAAGSTTEPG